ncbi:MAG: hypothetical protein N3A53_01610 [Verrucomicrobiae bacterium]|nr:hypothetical protein [Verrucomicrobiae bacterium]
MTKKGEVSVVGSGVVPRALVTWCVSEPPTPNELSLVVGQTRFPLLRQRVRRVDLVVFDLADARVQQRIGVGLEPDVWFGRIFLRGRPARVELFLPMHGGKDRNGVVRLVFAACLRLVRPGAGSIMDVAAARIEDVTRRVGWVKAK